MLICEFGSLLNKPFSPNELMYYRNKDDLNTLSMEYFSLTFKQKISYGLLMQYQYLKCKKISDSMLRV